MIPPGMTKKKNGRLSAVCTIATSAAFEVRELISHPAAMIIMKVPVLEKKFPTQRFLKSRCSSSPNPGPKSFFITKGDLRKSPKDTKTFPQRYPCC
jgi:hypothetical protein